MLEELLDDDVEENPDDIEHDVAGSSSESERTPRLRGDAPLEDAPLEDGSCDAPLEEICDAPLEDGSCDVGV